MLWKAHFWLEHVKYLSEYKEYLVNTLEAAFFLLEKFVLMILKSLCREHDTVFRSAHARLDYGPWNCRNFYNRACEHNRGFI